jgi:hypothetical protein
MSVSVLQDAAEYVGSGANTAEKVKLVLCYRSWRNSACASKRLRCVSHSHGKCTTSFGKASSSLPARLLWKGEPEDNTVQLLFKASLHFVLSFTVIWSLWSEC